MARPESEDASPFNWLSLLALASTFNWFQSSKSVKIDYGTIYLIFNKKHILLKNGKALLRQGIREYLIFMVSVSGSASASNIQIDSSLFEMGYLELAKKRVHPL